MPSWFERALKRDMTQHSRVHRDMHSLDSTDNHKSDVHQLSVIKYQCKASLTSVFDDGWLETSQYENHRQSKCKADRRCLVVF